VIYVRTNSFGQVLKERVTNLLATSFRGEVTLGQIDTSSWGALTIHELRIKYGNATVVRIPQIQLGYSLIPLLWHEARIDDLLCHRIGFRTFSGDLIWWNTPYSAEEVVRRARFLIVL